MLSNIELKNNAKHLILDLMQMKNFCEKPIIIKEAKNIYLTDINDKRYIDGISGIFVVNIGHNNEQVIEAIRKQQDKVSFVAPLHGVSDISIEYAKRLIEITPDKLKTIKFLTSGSEAIETAIKFMRQYFKQTGNSLKYKVISNYKGYHGATLGALSATGMGGVRKVKFGPLLEGFIHIPMPLCFRCPYGLEYPKCDILCGKMLKLVIENEGPESIGAFIVEPIGNTGGIITPPDEYFSIIRKICTDYNVMLIFDEIITGFGRTGNWFGAQTFNTTPDIICTGKGMGSGYAPLSSTIIRDDFYFKAFWGDESENIHFSHGHTFGGNPISSAAGLAVLDVIERGKLIDNGINIGKHIRNRVEKEVSELGIFGEVRGRGCLAGIEFVENMSTKKPFPLERKFGKKVEERLLEEGLILRCDPDWIAFAPPFITTIEQADEMVNIFIKCLKDELNSN